MRSMARTAIFATAALSLFGMAVSGALARGLGEAGEAEAARMNAKAGGPTNYRDAELLARYGCRDSRDSEYCWYLEQRRRAQARGLLHHKRHRPY